MRQSFETTTKSPAAAEDEILQHSPKWWSVYDCWDVRNCQEGADVMLVSVVLAGSLRCCWSARGYLH